MPKKPIIIGVTGGSGGGKTHALQKSNVTDPYNKNHAQS